MLIVYSFTKSSISFSLMTTVSPPFSIDNQYLQTFTQVAEFPHMPLFHEALAHFLKVHTILIRSTDNQLYWFDPRRQVQDINHLFGTL